MKLIIKKIAIGFPIGVFISASIALAIAVFGSEPMYSDVGYYIKAYFAGGALGVLFSVTGLIFGNEKWSLLKRSIIHFAITIPTLLGIAIWAGWVGNVLSYLISAIIVYAVFYLIFYFIEKIRVNKINKKILEN